MEFLDNEYYFSDFANALGLKPQHTIGFAIEEQGTRKQIIAKFFSVPRFEGDFIEAFCIYENDNEFSSGSRHWVRKSHESNLDYQAILVSEAIISAKDSQTNIIDPMNLCAQIDEEIVPRMVANPKLPLNVKMAIESHLLKTQTKKHDHENRDRALGI